MIDSHCHLADATFSDDLDAVVDRARHAGVERVLVILEAGNAQEAGQAERVEALWPEVRVSIGVHPHAAHEFADSPSAPRTWSSVSRSPGPRRRAPLARSASTTTTTHSPREVQQQVFRAQVRAARELDLPVVVHTREADEDTLTILREEGAGEVRGVLHCFTGTPALARAGLELGLYISLAGIVTFPKAAALRETAKAVPLERLLTETDSPFLAPVPFRGKRNEPAYVRRVVEVLGELRGIPADDLAVQTGANFHSLFRP